MRARYCCRTLGTLDYMITNIGVVDSVSAQEQHRDAHYQRTPQHLQDHTDGNANYSGHVFAEVWNSNRLLNKVMRRMRNVMNLADKA